MTQPEILSLIKAIIRKKSKLHVSRRQIFLTKHVQVEGGVDRVFFGVTIEKHAKAMFFGGLAVDWAASVASGLAPTPTGVLAGPIVAASTAGGKGGLTSSAIDAKFTKAFNAGLKSLTPAAEGTPHQLQLNSSYLSGQKAADNVGMYGVIDVDSASVKWRVTGDFSQHALWTDNLSLRPDLLDGGGETFPLGRAEGSPAILIGKSWVKYGD